MKQYITRGIVLARTDFGEADRIITFLTSSHGKAKAFAKSVRKSKSKLAGGIELFSISEITLIQGRGEINTLISARLVKHYGNIVKNIERTKLAYELINSLNRATEDEPEPEYFELLSEAFEALDNSKVEISLISIWFNMRLLKLAGHAPNLATDGSGGKLTAGQSYSINLEKMRFEPKAGGRFSTNHIKFLRLGFGAKRPQLLQRVGGSLELAKVCQPIIQTMLKSHVRV